MCVWLRVGGWERATDKESKRLHDGQYETGCERREEEARGGQVGVINT